MAVVIFQSKWTLLGIATRWTAMHFEKITILKAFFTGLTGVFRRLDKIMLWTSMLSQELQIGETLGANVAKESIGCRMNFSVLQLAHVKSLQFHEALLNVESLDIEGFLWCRTLYTTRATVDVDLLESTSNFPFDVLQLFFCLHDNLTYFFQMPQCRFSILTTLDASGIVNDNLILGCQQAHCLFNGTDTLFQICHNWRRNLAWKCLLFQILGLESRIQSSNSPKSTNSLVLAREILSRRKKRRSKHLRLSHCVTRCWSSESAIFDTDQPEVVPLSVKLSIEFAQSQTNFDTKLSFIISHSTVSKVIASKWLQIFDAARKTPPKSREMIFGNLNKHLIKRIVSNKDPVFTKPIDNKARRLCSIIDGRFRFNVVCVYVEARARAHIYCLK